MRWDGVHQVGGAEQLLRPETDPNSVPFPRENSPWISLRGPEVDIIGQTLGQCDAKSHRGADCGQKEEENRSLFGPFPQDEDQNRGDCEQLGVNAEMMCVS